MRFYPSAYSYGNVDPAVSPPAESSQLEKLLPIASAISEQIADPTQNAEVLKAKIANAKAYRRQYPMLHGVLTARIRKLTARLRAAQRRQALKSEEETSVRIFRKLGWLGGLAGIVAITSVTYFLVKKANK